MQARRLLSAALAAAAFAPALYAQEPLTFTVNQAASAWTWSGTSSFGPVVGNPSNNFSLTGTIEALLIQSAAQRLATGQVVSANTLVVPDISGKVNNPIPLFPPLAVIDVTGLAITFNTTSFVISPSGNFTAMMTATALSGTLTVTPLVGSQSMTDLTGEMGGPDPISGTVTVSGNAYTFNSPQNTTFSFSDPGSGASGTFTLIGNLSGDFTAPAPTTYCSTSPNSVGPGALIGTTGTTSLFNADLGLTATGCPSTQFGIFYYGPNQISLPFGQGLRCVGGTTARFPIIQTNAGGVANYPINFASLPANGALASGVTRNFQFWYRDPLGGPSGFNLTDGVSVLFVP